jgi:hypothetical protein
MQLYTKIPTVDEIKDADAEIFCNDVADKIVQSILDRTYICNVGSGLTSATMMFIAHSFKLFGWHLKFNIVDGKDFGTVDDFGEMPCSVSVI